MWKPTSEYNLNRYLRRAAGLYTHPLIRHWAQMGGNEYVRYVVLSDA